MVDRALNASFCSSLPEQFGPETQASLKLACAEVPWPDPEDAAECREGVQILAKNLPLGVELCQVLALLARPTFDHGPSLADIRRSQSTFVNIRLSTINPCDATGRQWITDMRSRLGRRRDYTAGKGFAMEFELIGGASDT